ncbi:hypothetical protein ACP70R_001458 [Stipagrostis hirtigluma subsp. patula]
MDAEGSALSGKASVDRRGRHGGMRAAVFILGFQAFQVIVLAAVGSNLITYVFGELHFSLPQAANVVTNFVGTVFLVSLPGGLLSDSYLGCFRTLLIFSVVEILGLILLSVQARLAKLKSAPCNMVTMVGSCERGTGFKLTIFFVALYLVALGCGCVMPNMTKYGADQQGFTYRTHSGMDVGFGVAAAAMPPQGSIFTPIARVFVAAFAKRKRICPSSSPGPVSAGASDPAPIDSNFRHADKFIFLDKACIRRAQQGPNTEPESAWRLCTVAEVQQAKTLLAVLPIFACTIVFNTALA